VPASCPPIHPVLRDPASASGPVGGRPCGAVVWFTGLSGSGKSTLAQGVHARLRQQGLASAVLDGDLLRSGLCADLGFSAADRAENVRRAAEVAAMMADAGLLVLVALISPFRAGRRQVRDRIAPLPFLEVYCNSPLAVCETRDPKGLYRRVRAGEVAEFTGITSPYEVPMQPELVLDTASASPEHCIGQVLHGLSALVGPGRQGAGGRS
jgi:adenylylsulfate kinase